MGAGGLGLPFDEERKLGRIRCGLLVPGTGGLLANSVPVGQAFGRASSDCRPPAARRRGYRGSGGRRLPPTCR